MTFTWKRRSLPATVALATAALALTACGGPQQPPSSSQPTQQQPSASSEPVEISWLTWNATQDVASAEAMIAAFTKAHPEITVRHETQPGGVEGDNLTKTKLATGEMEDVFLYNTGSLFHPLNPVQNLVPLDGEPWIADLNEAMKLGVTAEGSVYGAPWGSSGAGVVIYNKAIYNELGLKVPSSWAEFVANNEAVKAAGKTPVIQTYGDSWTGQLFVLGDFGNVYAQEPDWADRFTAGQAKYADQPALQAFLNLQSGYESGWWNRDFASATFDDGVRMVATGEGAHYPMLTFAISVIAQNYPELINDVGAFPLPAQNAADTRLTVWLPSGLYIPKTTEGAKLEAAKKFLAFVNSPEGCAVQNEMLPPTGPYFSACELPDEVPEAMREMQPFFDQNKAVSSLEFVSPVKGPNFAGILVEVGSGIRSAQDGAALVDEDNKKQAEQLGLPGW